MKYHLLLLLAVLCISQAVRSADIAREINQPVSGNSSFSEIGLSLVSGQLPLAGFNGNEVADSEDAIVSISIGLEARLEYKDFFLEFIENSFSDVTLGFSAQKSEESHHEVVLTTFFSRIKRNDLQSMETITKRDGDFNLGFRSMYYLGQNIVQVELAHDILNSHNGYIGALHFGHQKQVRNWHLHGLLGVRYFSDNVLDHYFGVSEAEATAEYQPYQAGDGFMPSIQLGATVPINEKLIFRASAEYAHLPSAVSDSPLAQGDSMHVIQAGVYYVFNGG